MFKNKVPHEDDIIIWSRLMKNIYKHTLKKLLFEVSFKKPLESSKDDWAKHFEKKFIADGPGSEFHADFIASFEGKEDSEEEIEMIGQEIMDKMLASNEEGKEEQEKVKKIVDKGDEKLQKDMKQTAQKIQKKSNNSGDIYKSYAEEADSIRKEAWTSYDGISAYAEKKNFYWIFELLEVGMNEHYKFVGTAGSLCVKYSDNTEKLKELTQKLLEIEKLFKKKVFDSVVNNKPLQTPQEVIKLMQEYR